MIYITAIYLSVWFVLCRCHEYEKHGTCTELREYDFFSKGLELFNEIGIFGTMLSKGNIIPSKETTYDVGGLIYWIR